MNETLVKWEGVMRRTFIQVLNNGSTSYLSYPVIFFMLVMGIEGDLPINLLTLNSYLAGQEPLVQTAVRTAIYIPILVIGYFYFKIIFSNYWSASAFFILLAVLDIRASLLLLVVFFGLGVLDLALENMGSSRMSSRSYSNKNNSYETHDFLEDESSFSHDYAVGYASGVGTTPGGLAGASARNADTLNTNHHI